MKKLILVALLISLSFIVSAVRDYDYNKAPTISKLQSVFQEIEPNMEFFVTHSMKHNVEWNITEAEESLYNFTIIKNSKIFPIGGKIQ